MVGKDVEDVSWPLVQLPVETLDTIGGRWFHTYGPEGPKYRQPDTLVEWLHSARRCGGNLLLSVPPAPEGLIPEGACNVLTDVGRLLRMDDSQRDLT